MSIVVVNTEQSTSTLSDLTDKHVQQAAVDISLEHVWAMHGMFELSEDGKATRTTTPIEPDEDGFYNLPEGAYEVSFPHEVKMGADEAAIIVTRSTLVRNGVFLVSGVWDPAFHGKGGCCMHVRGGPFRVKKGTRVGQFVIWKVLNAQGAYNGTYGKNADGTLKSAEQKYYKGE